MSDPGPEDEGVIRTGPAGGGILAVGDQPADYIPVEPHKIIIVCPCSLRRRTRWALKVTRRKTDVMACPECARRAYKEVVGTTTQSAHFEWPASGVDQG